jgi:hypothetical protein
MSFENNNIPGHEHYVKKIGKLSSDFIHVISWIKFGRAFSTLS